MTDIDFDELDKAVNTLMGTVGSKDKEDQPKEKTFTVSSTLQPGEKPSYERIGEVASHIGSETLVGRGERTIVEDLPDPDTVAASGGTESIAPDTEHHTDAAEQKAEPESPTELRDEQKATDAEMVIEPESPADSAADVAPAPNVTDNEPEKPAAPAVKRPNSGRFMDVVHPSLDMRSPSDTPALSVPERQGSRGDTSRSGSSGTAKSTEQNDNVAALQDAVPTIPTNPIPLTPFLPDAKVEKRPLGESPAAAGASDDKEDDDAPSDESDNKSDAQRLLDASDFSAVSNAESQALQQIETNGIDENLAAEIPADTASSPDVPDVMPSSEMSIQQIESGDTEHLSSGTAQAAVEQPVDVNGDVYGVKQHAPALEHPAKQKSGWGTVVIIILVIIALAGAGVAAYFVLGAGS